MDRVRERWSQDEPALNAWCTLEGATAASVLAHTGFDAVTLDLQHGSAGTEEVGLAAPAIERAGAVPFARLRWNDPGLAMRALDLGARGVICPMVESREQAETFVRACRYPPGGARSYGPVQGAFGTGREQTEQANARVLTFAQVETADGLRAVEEIASTPGLDGLYVGPADLSLALGLGTFADLSDAGMLDALDAVLAACARAEAVPGIHAPGPERTEAMIARGFRFVGVVGDVDLLSAAAGEALAHARRASPRA